MPRQHGNPDILPITLLIQEWDWLRALHLRHGAPAVTLGRDLPEFDCQWLSLVYRTPDSVAERDVSYPLAHQQG